MQPAEIFFLLWILNFNAYTYKKKYLVDFSIKFNELKFCTLLMNWLRLYTGSFVLSTAAKRNFVTWIVAT